MYRVNDKFTVADLKEAQKIAVHIARTNRKTFESEDILWWETLLCNFGSMNTRYGEVFHDEMTTAVRKVSKAMEFLDDTEIRVRFGNPYLHAICSPDKEGQGMDHGSVNYVTPVLLGNGDIGMSMNINSGVSHGLANQPRYDLRADHPDRIVHYHFSYLPQQKTSGRRKQRFDEAGLREILKDKINKKEIYSFLSRNFAGNK